jgi:hypothetical protein
MPKTSLKITILNNPFNLSEENIVRQRIKRYVFVMEDIKLVRLVEEIQKFRKESIEVLMDINKNIDKKS